MRCVPSPSNQGQGTQHELGGNHANEDAEVDRGVPPVAGSALHPVSPVAGSAPNPIPPVAGSALDIVPPAWADLHDQEATGASVWW